MESSEEETMIIVPEQLVRCSSERRKPPHIKRRRKSQVKRSSTLDEEMEMDIPEEQFTRFIEEAGREINDKDTKMKAEAEVQPVVKPTAFMSDSEEEEAMSEQSIRLLLETQGRRRHPPHLFRRSSRSSMPWPQRRWYKKKTLPHYDPEEIKMAVEYFVGLFNSRREARKREEAKILQPGSKSQDLATNLDSFSGVGTSI